MLNQHYLQSNLAFRGRTESRNAYVSILITSAFCAVGLGLVYVATQTTAFLNAAEPIAAILGVGLCALGWWRWQTGVKVLLVIVIVEGALRKWFLPSYAEIVYFYKDALMVAILIGYVMHRPRMPFVIKPEIKIFSVMVTVFVVYALALVANPSAPHPIVSVFGVKAYCLYMPLIFLVPRMFTTKEQLTAFLRWYLVIALAVAALGLWQFMDGSQDSPLNRYAWSDEASGWANQDTAIFADAEGTYFVRITSSFSYVSGLTVYLPVMFALLLGLTSLRSIRTLPRGIRWIYYAAIGATVITAFMCGSRGAIVDLVVVAVAFYAFTSIKNVVPRLRQFGIAAILIYLSVIFVAPQAVSALRERAFGGADQIAEGRARIASVFSIPFEEAGYAGAIGYGIGATQNGVPALMRTLGLTHSGDRIPKIVEGESSRVMLDLGVVGFALFTLMRLGILLVVWRACMLIRDPDCKALAGAALAALLFPLVAGGAVVNHTQNVYQWFLIGMTFALLNADKLKRLSSCARTNTRRELFPANPAAVQAVAQR